MKRKRVDKSARPSYQPVNLLVVTTKRNVGEAIAVIGARIGMLVPTPVTTVEAMCGAAFAMDFDIVQIFGFVAVSRKPVFDGGNAISGRARIVTCCTAAIATGH